MPIAYEGQKGQGHTGYTKYGVEGAPVVKNGGNDPIHDGVETAGPGKSNKDSSYNKE